MHDWWEKRIVYGNFELSPMHEWWEKRINLFLFFMVSAVTPSEPTNFQMSLVEQVYIRVKWDPPRSTVPVVFYRIFYKPKMSKEQYVVVSHVSLNIGIFL